MIKTGLIGDKFSSKLCYFPTTSGLFSQVIHHNDKVKPKKLSGFTLTIMLDIQNLFGLRINTDIQQDKHS